MLLNIYEPKTGNFVTSSSSRYILNIYSYRISAYMRDTCILRFFSVEIFSHSKTYSPRQHSNLPFLHMEHPPISDRIEGVESQSPILPAMTNILPCHFSHPLCNMEFQFLLTQERSNLTKNQLHLSSFCTLYGSATTKKELMGGGEKSPP